MVRLEHIPAGNDALLRWVADLFPEHDSIDPAVVLYHELRSPLALIATLAASISDANDPLVLERFRAIHETAQRMLRTSEAVVAAAGASTCDTHEQRLFFPAVVIRRFFEGVGVFDLDIQEECTAAAERAVIVGHPVVLEALLQSLISNAFDHGDTRFKLGVAMSVRRRYFRLRLTNRVGMSKRKGSGIGHYLCHRMVEQLGGSIELERRGNYFQVLVELPLWSTVRSCTTPNGRADQHGASSWVSHAARSSRAPDPADANG